MLNAQNAKIVFFSFHPKIGHVSTGCMIVLVQVSRTIGDAYLKRAEFNREPLQAKFCLQEPFKKPILSSEPSISAQPLQREDQFLIFASDGLWEHLSNQEAVDIVQHHPRSVCCAFFTCLLDHWSLDQLWTFDLCASYGFHMIMV